MGGGYPLPNHLIWLDNKLINIHSKLTLKSTLKLILKSMTADTATATTTRAGVRRRAEGRGLSCPWLSEGLPSADCRAAIAEW